MRRTIVVFLFLAGCGGSSGPSPAPVAQATPVPAPVPAPAPSCEPWPSELASMMARLPLPTGLCLRYESGPGQSTYGNKIITIRQDNNPFGNLARIAHELGHAHQDWLGASVGGGIDDFIRTPEGQAYLTAGGWAPVPNCSPSRSPSCWTQDINFCERNFCQVATPNGGNYGTPLEENADYIGTWYNPGNISGWGSVAFSITTPRRSAWAKVWLP